MAIDRAYAGLQNICNTLLKITVISEYSFGISIQSNFKGMTLNATILDRSQLGIDDGSGYTPTEMDISYVT